MVINRREFLGMAGGLLIGREAFSLDDLLQDAKVEVLLKGGQSENKFNIVILPEGFTKNMRKDFDKEMDTLLAGMDKFAFWKEYKPVFTWSKIWVPSDSEWSTSSNGDGTALKIKYNKEDGHPELTDDNILKPYKELAKAHLPVVLLKEKEKNGKIGYSNTDEVITGNYLYTFYHEIGHGFDLRDEYTNTEMAGFNITTDKDKAPWKDLIGKVKDIGIYEVKGEKIYRGEKNKCLMQTVSEGTDFEILCHSLMIAYLRKFAKCIDTATKEELLSLQKGKPLGIEFKTTASTKYTPTTKAWYCTGTAEELDKFAEEMRGQVLTDKSFADKKWKAAKIAAKGKALGVEAVLTPGNYIVAVTAYDPNPAIIFDPENATKDKRVYRVEVKE